MELCCASLSTQLGQRLHGSKAQPKAQLKAQAHAQTDTVSTWCHLVGGKRLRDSGHSRAWHGMEWHNTTREKVGSLVCQPGASSRCWLHLDTEYALRLLFRLLKIDKHHHPAIPSCAVPACNSQVRCRQDSRPTKCGGQLAVSNKAHEHSRHCRQQLVASPVAMLVDGAHAAGSVCLLLALLLSIDQLRQHT